MNREPASPSYDPAIAERVWLKLKLDRARAELVERALAWDAARAALRNSVEPKELRKAVRTARDALVGAVAAYRALGGD